MGNHRADHHASTRPRSESPETPYVGRRIAGRETASPAGRRVAGTPTAVELPEPPVQELPERPVPEPAQPGKRRAADPVVDAAPVEETGPPAALFDATTTAGSLKPAQPGKRKAVRHAGRRGPLFRGLPSMPVVVGVATLAVAVGGVLTTTDTQLVGAEAERITAPNAASGSIGSGVYDASDRTPTVSRGSQREGLDTTGELVAQAQQQAEQRSARLGQMAQQAEKTAKEISSNRWVLPMDGYRLTARFGEYGLWASYHTGLDFAAPSGTPIHAVASGVVTFTGYDGSYGNKTVITLEDGTEIWYCHQTDYVVAEGETVAAGELIGYVGSTGNSTGPHLHLEVRPGGGDPVDPYAAMVVNGVTP